MITPEWPKSEKRIFAKYKMGCKGSTPKTPALTKRKKEPQRQSLPSLVRPDHSEKYPHLNYMTGEITWKALDAYDKLERSNAQRNINNDIFWSPSRSEWQCKGANVRHLIIQ
jgi:hypothetical protein